MTAVFSTVRSPHAPVRQAKLLDNFSEALLMPIRGIREQGCCLCGLFAFSYRCVSDGPIRGLGRRSGGDTPAFVFQPRNNVREQGPMKNQESLARENHQASGMMNSWHKGRHKTRIVPVRSR